MGTPTINDEYGSARNSNLTSNKFGAFFSALLAKKQDLCTFQDTNKRKPLINAKDSLWLVTPRNKVQVDSWFRDLASGSKPLSVLARKIPIFHKKEEVLQQLVDHSVPSVRAAFYVKAFVATSAASNDSGTKGKKRQASDPSQEWSSAICRALKDIFVKIYDSNTSSSVIPSLRSQWEYLTRFARHMFEELLLDKNDFLTWLLDLFEKTKPEESAIRLVTPLILTYSEDFADHEVLSRRLAYHCSKRLAILMTDPSSSDDSVEKKDTIEELLACPHHRSLTLIYSAVIQIITMKCKTAMIWHPHHDSKHMHASLNGSPLDHLPVAPSELPMAKCPDEESVRQEMREAEEEIRLRSIAVENKWASQRWQTSEGSPTTRLLSTLDTLDKHCFDKIDSNSSMDILYSKIFSPISRSREDTEAEALQEILSQDEAKVRLLCEWAVTHKRSGEHRSMVVSRLLERRQNELIPESENESIDDREPETIPQPVFQAILLNFLDTQAPVLDDKGSNRLESRMAFSNLVLLFSELIRCEVFSHDQYMCSMISRGLFSEQESKRSISSDSKTSVGSQGTFLSGFNPHSGVHASSTASSGPDSLQRHASESSLPMFDPLDTVGSTPHQGLSWDTPQMDMDDARIDADLDKLLQNIKEGQQNSNHDHDILLPETVSPDKTEDGTAASADALKSAAQRHLLYTTHFPLVQDETTLHECNQRLVLLYGVGKNRDEARHTVKKVSKEILKLFSRKASMDIAEGGKIKKSAVKDGFNFESALTRFQALSFFDQHYVTATCASTCIEMLNAVGNASANYLPLVESIAFLFDLMDMALNVHGMIDFIIQMLKELVEVEMQLQHRCPILSFSYTSSIGLYIVGVLFRFQPCLLVSHEDTFAVFEGCLKLVKHVANPADCSSAERCILGYIYDLYSSCSILQQKYHDVVPIHALLSKVKTVIYSAILPSALTLLWNTNYMLENITNPKSKVDPVVLKQLNENVNCRYSFVCSVLKAIASTRDANLLNELAILCAELSARCPNLSGDWIGLLKALCCSSNHACGFMDALSSINVNDHSIHDNVAIFTSILVARRCFSLQDFVIHCALPSLLAACPQGGGDLEAEPGARLTCHLLLCLFRTSELPLSSATVTSTPATTLYSLTSPGPANLTPNLSRPTYVIKHPCDRYLLAAAHSCMRVEAVIAVLKAILVLGDANADSLKPEVQINDLLKPIDDDDDFSDFVLPFGNRSTRQENMENAGLGEFAKLSLKQICSQDWVHEKCLRDREMLCKPDLLLDTMLSSKQAQQLLDMICHPRGSGPILSSDHDQRQYVTHILQNLDEWTLRISWLQLQLIYAQCSASQSSSEVSNWLESLAKAIIDFFQSCSEDNVRTSLPPPTTLSKGSKSNQSHKQKAPPLEVTEAKEYKVWLVSPLVSRLPSALQGRILRVTATQVLESGNWMTPVPPPGSYSSSKNKDRFNQPKSQNTASLLLSYPPFLSLVLMCLKGQDDQREHLLKSLYSQLEQAHENQKPTDDLKTKQTIHDGLQLRLGLIGSMFDMIQKSNQTLTEWSLCLLALISTGVVDPQLNYELFTTVLDMLCVLIHSTLASDSGEAREDAKKYYQNLMKKLRKEINNEKCNFSINCLKQLVPPSKYLKSVITCEPMGSLIDTKGNKIAGFDSIDKKQGLQVADKVWINPWELLEGQKNPAPLCWSWFGVVRHERKPLRCEEAVNALQWHSHSLKKPTSYFLEAPPLPPEEVDPIPVTLSAPPVAVSLPPPEVKPSQLISQIPSYSLHVPDEVMKRESSTPTEMMSPRTATKVTKPRKPRQRKNAKNQSPASIASGQSTPPVRGTPPFDGYPMNPVQQPQTQMPQQQQPPIQQPQQGNWNYNQNPMPGPGVMNQQPSYNQPMYGHPNQQQMQMPSQVPQTVPQGQPPQRFERRGTPGKEALNTMLRARHPPQQQTPQFMHPQQQGSNVNVGNIQPPNQQMFQQQRPGMANPRGVRPQVMNQQQTGQGMQMNPQQPMTQQSMAQGRMQVIPGNQGMYQMNQGIAGPPQSNQSQMQPQGYPQNVGYQTQIQSMQQDNSLHSLDQPIVMNQGSYGIPQQQQTRGMRPQAQQFQR